MRAMSARRRTWQKLVARAARTKDPTGQPLDPAIVPCVVGLWAHGIPTIASCEGHEGALLPYPWIDVGAGDLEVLLGRTPRARKRAMVRANLRVQRRLLALLATFYLRRRVPYDVQLVPNCWPEWGGLRLQTAGADASRLLGRRARAARRARERREFAAFASFLELKFLGSARRARSAR
jgi:hypothetical protein